MLRTIWIGMLIAGFVLLMLAIILTFALKIPALVDELSGRKAKRQIKRLKELNRGTAGLENMGTEEVYSAMSSGSLLSSEMAKLESEGNNSFSQSPSTLASNTEVEASRYQDTVQEYREPQEEPKDEEDIPTTNLAQDEDDIATGFVNTPDEGTTLMDEDLSTDELHAQVSTIRIIEEQSSIL